MRIEPQNYNEAKKVLKDLCNSVSNKTITEHELILKITARTVLLLTSPSLKKPNTSEFFVKGLPISHGAVVGKLCTTKNAIDLNIKNNWPTIYITRSVKSDEIMFLDKINGLVAIETDPSSHAAIICKDKGLPFISKINNNIEINENEILINGITIKVGSWVSIDAFSGNIYFSKQSVIIPKPQKELQYVLSVINKTKRLKVFGNADTPLEVAQAIKNGAEGVEPRTEHMFYEQSKLLNFQKVIISSNKEEIKKILEVLEAEQVKDFVKILTAVKGLPAHIRLLDPPLHEFLPTSIENIKKLAREIKVSYSKVTKKIHTLTEVNPMSGHRGVRLLITYPELAIMQIRALFKASVILYKNKKKFTLRIVIPMVIETNEIIIIKRIISEVHDDIQKKFNININYKVGIMVETPRAAMTSSQIAKSIDFFSFGTNDLSAFVFGFSRGDVYEKFLINYLESNILRSDPFFTLDKSVSKLVSHTVKTMLKYNPLIESSICGEQSAEEKTIKLCDSIGMTSISCNPPKILIAKLFAAKAAILNNKKIIL